MARMFGSAFRLSMSEKLSPSPETAQKRIYYIDSGRALASILGIFYHTALVFSTPWLINIEPERFARGLYVISSFISNFRMPLFLFIAGYFTMYSINKYVMPDYLAHRTRRIALPFLASLLTLLPIQAYFRTKFNYGQQWSDHIGPLLNPISSNFTMEHLWFLYYIIMFSLVVAGFEVFRRLFKVKTAAQTLYSLANRSFISAIIFWSSVNLMVTIPLTLLASRLSLDNAWFPLGGLAHNSVMFMFGAYCFRHRDEMDQILSPSPMKTLLGLVTVLALYSVRIYLEDKSMSHAWMTLTLMDIPLRWLLTLGVLSLLRQALNSGSPALNYLSNASYPVYLFHQPIIVGISYYYVSSGMKLNPYLGYALVCGSALILTYALYEVIIRRTRMGSFLYTGSSARATRAQSA